MAIVTVPAAARRITDKAEIAGFLADHGIHYETWPLEDRVDPAAPAEQILAAYAPEIDELKRRGGFVTADVIDVYPDTPNLDAMLAKFSKEHTHSEDEVRFTVKGSGIFHIHPKNGPVFGIQVESGDLINVPCGTQHWFDLCNDKTIRCIRLFQDKSGWTPHYVENSLHENYPPVCLGPSYVKGAAEFQPVVKV